MMNMFFRDSALFLIGFKSQVILPCLLSGLCLVLTFINAVAFGRRFIPAGSVAPPANTPRILGRRALPTGRLDGIGASPYLRMAVLNVRSASGPSQ